MGFRKESASYELNYAPCLCLNLTKFFMKFLKYIVLKCLQGIVPLVESILKQDLVRFAKYAKQQNINTNASRA